MFVECKNVTLKHEIFAIVCWSLLRDVPWKAKYNGNCKKKIFLLTLISLIWNPLMSSFNIVHLFFLCVFFFEMYNLVTITLFIRVWHLSFYWKRFVDQDGFLFWRSVTSVSYWHNETIIWGIIVRQHVCECFIYLFYSTFVLIDNTRGKEWTVTFF